MAINLDDRINNQEDVVIAGKNYKVTFNDDFRKQVSAVMLKAQEEIHKAEQIDNKKINSMTHEEKTELLDNVFESARQAMTDFFDKCFGKGEGKRIFDFYHQDTSALQKIMAILQKEADKETRQNFKSKKNKYTSNKR